MSATVISLADSSTQVLKNLIAHTLHTTPDNIVPACMRLAARLSAQVEDGYILYRHTAAPEVLRAALVVNLEVDGKCFPMVYHQDNGESAPMALLLATMEYQWLGDFVDHITSDENVWLYHALADHIPMHLNGIGIIQALHLARQQGITPADQVGLQRVAKQTLQLLQT